jgi:hypothetical protein
VEGFYLELIGKFLSYQDVNVEIITKKGKLLMDLSSLIKKVIGKIIFTRRTGEKELTLFDRWTCANSKE